MRTFGGAAGLRPVLVCAVLLLMAAGLTSCQASCPGGSIEEAGFCRKFGGTAGDTELAGTDAAGAPGATAGMTGSNKSGLEQAVAGSSAGTASDVPAGVSGSTGVGGAAGTGGTGGTGGAGGSGQPSTGDPCNAEGQTRCSALGSGKRESCTSGHWKTAEPCAMGQACTGVAGQVTCTDTNELCRGTGGKTICDPHGLLLVCNPDDTVAFQKQCNSLALCQAGIAARECPACLAKVDHHCNGKTLEVCADDGKGFAKLTDCATTGLCNELLGMCTTATCAAGKYACQQNTLAKCNADGTGFESMVPCGADTCDGTGGDCNKCHPGTKTCMNGLVATCDTTGQTYNTAACPSGTKCTGAGTCLACIDDSECSSLTKGCTVGVCMGNKCMGISADSTTQCTTSSSRPGTCNAGTCVCTRQCNKPCGSDGCDGKCPDQCAAQGQMCSAAERCVDCLQRGDCAYLDSSDGCKSGSCTNAGSCTTTSNNGIPCANGTGTCTGGTCVICQPKCGANTCGGSNSCGGTCPDRCSDVGKICKNNSCVAPPTLDPLYQPCTSNDNCNGAQTCTQVGPKGPYCYLKADASGGCPSGLVAYFGTVCLARCSSGCPSLASQCYMADPPNGYCVPEA